MKIAAVEIDGVRQYGQVKEDRFLPFSLDRRLVTDLATVINQFKNLSNDFPSVSLEGLKLVAPIGPLRKNIYCVGKNYVDHSHEFAKSGFDTTNSMKLPEYPIVFTKAPSTIANPGQVISVGADPTESVDYEGELGVVIGKQCKGVNKADAIAYVFGYTIINDLTSRELQKRHNQWFIGKNLDGFCPVGPWVVTADEMGELDDIRLQTFVNGEVRQSAVLQDLIFDIPTIISTLASYMTLEPGDVIATGTPVGVGIGFTPPKFLKPGDEVRISIDRIGELTNTFS